MSRPSTNSSLRSASAWRSTSTTSACTKTTSSARKAAGDNVIPFPGSAQSDADEFPSDAHIEETVQHLHTFLQDNIPGAASQLGLIDTENVVRLRPLNDAFKRVREARGLSIKDVSKALKAPQYRLRDVEGASRRPFHHGVFVKYRDFLDLGDSRPGKASAPAARALDWNQQTTQGGETHAQPSQYFR